MDNRLFRDVAAVGVSLFYSPRVRCLAWTALWNNFPTACYVLIGLVITAAIAVPVAVIVVAVGGHQATVAAAAPAVGLDGLVSFIVSATPYLAPFVFTSLGAAYIFGAGGVEMFVAAFLFLAAPNVVSAFLG